MATTTLSNAINCARTMTSFAANLKDYQVRNKRLRALRALAQDTLNGKGYIIASANEMTERYGKLVAQPFSMIGGNDKKHLWGLNKVRYPSSGKLDIQFCCIH